MPGRATKTSKHVCCQSPSAKRGVTGFGSFTFPSTPKEICNPGKTSTRTRTPGAGVSGWQTREAFRAARRRYGRSQALREKGERSGRERVHVLQTVRLLRFNME